MIMGLYVYNLSEMNKKNGLVLSMKTDWYVITFNQDKDGRSNGRKLYNISTLSFH